MNSFDFQMISGSLSDELLKSLCQLKNKVFEVSPVDFEKLKYEFDTKYGLVTHFAYDGDKLIAFKTGYEKNMVAFIAGLVVYSLNTGGKVSLRN